MSRRARVVEIFKSVLIVLLMAAMLLLFLLTWSTDPDSLPEGVGRVVSAVSGFFGGGFEAAPVVEGSRADTYGEASPPNTVAVMRNGSLEGFFACEGTLDEAYSHVQLTLADCLGSAEGQSNVSQREFLLAANEPGAVFIRYSGAQPLSLIALSHGVEAYGVGGEMVASLLLAPGGENVILYAAGGGQYMRMATAVADSRLGPLFDGISGADAAYSSDLGFDGAELAVYPARELRVPVITVQPSAMSESAVTGLMSAFGMNTESNYRYVSSDGTQYAVENGVTLAVGSDGSIAYSSGEDGGIGLRPDAADAGVIEFCRAILESGSAGVVGDAEWTLRGFERTEERAEVRFGYTVNGLPLYVGEYESAAEFVIEEGRLTEAHIALLRCASGAESALMMPPASAAVVGLSEPAYFTGGGYGEVVPQWSR